MNIYQITRDLIAKSTDTWDERIVIDAHAWVYFQGYQVKSITDEGIYYQYPRPQTVKIDDKLQTFGGRVDNFLKFDLNGNLMMRFTSSRDALKAVRPEGIRNWQIVMGKRQTFGCGIEYPGAVVFESNMLPTEELAELDAIMQAVEHIRQTDPSYSPIKKYELASR